MLRRGEDVEVSLFPFGSTMVSMSVELSDGRSVEVASIGREGAVGGIISCGHAPAFSSAVVLVGGPALRVPIRVLEEAKRRSTFVANIFCRFSDYLLSQVMQSAVCNASHSIEQRAARWLLLAQDRAGDRIELTQAGACRAAWCPADVGQRGDPVVAGGRARRKQPRGRSSRRPGGPQALFVRMLPGDRRPFRRGDRNHRSRDNLASRPASTSRSRPRGTARCRGFRPALERRRVEA